MNDKKVMLITGTRKGIGQYLAAQYLSAGYAVIGCSRGKAEIDHADYTHYELDVTNEPAVLAMFTAIRKKIGRLDILINNAGIASMNHTVLTPLQTVHNVLGTNVVGTFLFCREAAKLMQRRKFGRIVNFSTVAVPMKLEGEAIYAASKAAVVSLTQVLAKEFSTFGITVNAVGPTPVETDLIKSVPKDKIQKILDQQSLPRFGTVEDVKNVVDFFIDDASSFVTGQCVYLGGV